MFLTINFTILIALLLVVALVGYFYFYKAVPNAGELANPDIVSGGNAVNDQLINDVFNDTSVQPGLDSYAQYNGPNPTAKNTGDTVEYKGKKFRAPDSSDQSLFNVQNYLPQEQVSDWFENPSTAVTLTDANLIDNRDFIGVNTVGSSLRNASLDLRGAPPCPRVGVSPWNNSTIEPDNNLKSVCQL